MASTSELTNLRRAVAWQVYVRCHMVRPLTVPRRIEWTPARYDSIYYEAMAEIAADEGDDNGAAVCRRIAGELATGEGRC